MDKITKLWPILVYFFHYQITSNYWGGVLGDLSEIGTLVLPFYSGLL